MAISPIGAMMSAATAAPVAGAQQVGAAGAASATSQTGQASGDFGNVVVNALQGVESSQDTANSLAVQAATGNLADVHQYTIAATEASLQTEMTVAVRDRAVEAFNSDHGDADLMAAIDLDRIRDQGKQFVDGFTPGQKAMTILGVIAVVLASMAFSHWSSSTNYAPLYTSLSGADAGKVTQALDSAGVKWKLADGGATVLVPAALVYKERVALSAQGLPASSDDLSLLDKEGITASEFVQRVDYQRAMQGELEKTIEAIDGVASATVNLTIPPDQVFAGAQTDAPSAAVLVQPAGGTTLSTDAVQAIVHLVASSIPNMTPDSVTVADSSGNVLNAPGMDLSSGQGLEQQTSFDTALSTAVSTYLATALGPNHADVHVQSDMNFDQQKTTSVTSSAPGGKPIPAQQNTSTENFKGPSSAAAGVLGVNGTPAGAGLRQRGVLEDDEPEHQRAEPGRDRGPTGAREDQPALGRGAARQLGREAGRRRRTGPSRSKPPSATARSAATSCR